MKKFPLLYVVAALALAGLNGCYTPRDVRPAAVAAAKVASERDLPGLAAQTAALRSDRAKLATLFEAYLASHPGVFGVAFAPVPARGPALYVCRKGTGVTTRELQPPLYDYARTEWYRKPLESGSAVWSAPYFDREGGNVWMQTYSVPATGGVLTNDVPVYGPDRT